MKIGLIGFGSLGRQIANLLDAPAGDLAVFDDIAFERMEVSGPEAHPFDAWREAPFADLHFYVCLGYKHLARKREILDELRSLGRRTPALVHPSCFVNRTASVGEGSILYPMCNIDQNVRLGRGVTLHNSAIVSHDSSVGDGSYLSPGVVLCGESSIGRGCFIGARAVISNGVKIGDNAVVGIGAVVTRDLPEGVSAVGNPLRVLAKPLRLS